MVLLSILPKKGFQMSQNIHELLDQYKREVKHRTDHTQAPFGAPQLSTASVQFEIGERTHAVAYGGIALIHEVANQSGLIDALNAVQVLKLNLPYHESDHLLSIAFNFLCGGTALEHIEYRRQDPTYLNMLGTHSIPDPTTAGDFCRRYSATGINLLQDKINEARLNVWARQPKSFFDVATVDLDGVLAPTDGECKEGIDIAYNGQWCYHPLVVSLSNTKEILYTMNRSGNRPSHEGAHMYIDKSIELLREAGFQTIRFRGDTDFSQTKHLDRWDEEGVFFVFGIDAMPNLKDIAESLENTEWEPLVRPPKYVALNPLGKRENVKKTIVEARGYRNMTLEREDVAIVDYRPVACERSYRLVILRKTITVKKGQELLLPEIRYFFYITNDCDASAAEIVFESNARCNQENLLAQLKGGMNALSLPLDTLNANWVYLVCAGLAWSLKSWSALWLVVDESKPEECSSKKQLLSMEFRTFLQAMIHLPAQIIKSGRRVIVRLLNVNDWSSTFFRLVEQVRPVRHCRRE
jgi:hypothetical protein